MVKIDVKAEQLFPVKCAWCGKTTRFSTIDNNHSICKECSEETLLESQVKSTDPDGHKKEVK